MPSTTLHLAISHGSQSEDMQLGCVRRLACHFKQIRGVSTGNSIPFAEVTPESIEISRSCDARGPHLTLAVGS